MMTYCFSHGRLSSKYLSSKTNDRMHTNTENNKKKTDKNSGDWNDFVVSTKGDDLNTTGTFMFLGFDADDLFVQSTEPSTNNWTNWRSSKPNSNNNTEHSSLVCVATFLSFARQTKSNIEQRWLTVKSIEKCNRIFQEIDRFDRWLCSRCVVVTIRLLLKQRKWQLRNVGCWTRVNRSKRSK